MSVICPKDKKPCGDDLCQDGDCTLTGELAWHRCPYCRVNSCDPLDVMCEKCARDNEPSAWGYE